MLFNKRDRDDDVVLFKVADIAALNGKERVESTGKERGVVSSNAGRVRES